MRLLREAFFDGWVEERLHQLALPGIELVQAAVVDAPLRRGFFSMECVQNPHDEDAQADDNGQTKDATEQNVLHVPVLRSSAVRLLRLSRLGLGQALASESLAVRIGELLYKAPRKLARSGSERAKTAFNIEEERGRVVRIK
jgi:hypothetical protein